MKWYSLSRTYGALRIARSVCRICLDGVYRNMGPLYTSLREQVRRSCNVRRTCNDSWNELVRRVRAQRGSPVRGAFVLDDRNLPTQAAKLGDRSVLRDSDPEHLVAALTAEPTGLLLLSLPHHLGLRELGEAALNVAAATERRRLLLASPSPAPPTGDRLHLRVPEDLRSIDGERDHAQPDDRATECCLLKDVHTYLLEEVKGFPCAHAYVSIASMNEASSVNVFVFSSPTNFIVRRPASSTAI